MGLRGIAGTRHIDGGHAELNAAQCTAEGAESVFPRGEFALEEAEQLEAARAAILVQEAKQKYERLGRLVQILVQARRKVGVTLVTSWVEVCFEVGLNSSLFRGKEKGFRKDSLFRLDRKCIF